MEKKKPTLEKIEFMGKNVEVNKVQNPTLKKIITDCAHNYYRFCMNNEGGYGDKYSESQGEFDEDGIKRNIYGRRYKDGYGYPDNYHDEKWDW